MAYTPGEQILIILGVLTVIISLGLMIQAYFYHKKNKLQFLVGPSFSLVKIKETYKDKIQVSYDGIHYDDLSSIELTIINSGNFEILKDDILKPVRFTFDNQLNVIDYKEVSTKPDGINYHISRNNNNFFFDFDLLKPKWEIKLQFVCVGVGNIQKPNIDAKYIKDTKINIIEYKKYIEEKNSFKNIIKYFFTSLIGFGILYLVTLTQNPFLMVGLFMLGLFLVLASSILLVYVTWSSLIKELFSYRKRRLLGYKNRITE